MKSFIKKVCIYSVVIVGILYAFPLAIYVISKDYISIKKAVEIQIKNPEALIGFSYFGGRTVAHKKLLIEHTEPDILVFGSSRTFQISKDFFKENKSFVNAAVPRPSIGNLVNAQELIALIPNDGKKRVLLLLLDKRFFTERYDTSSDKNGDSFILKFIHLVGKPLRLVYLDYVAHKYSFLDLIEQSRTTNNIGLWALVKDSGHRLDGSFREGYEMSIPNRKDILKNDISGRVFEIQHYDETLLKQEQENIPKNIEGLETILKLSKAKNIDVIAFIPPDPILVAHEISNGTTTYSQVQNILADDIKAVLSKYSYRFFNLSDITLYNGRDEEFLDLIHGGDLLYAKVILYLAEHDAEFKKYVDVLKLRTMIQNAKGDFLNI